MKALWDSLIRTLTPIAVGGIVAFFAAQGIALDPQFEPTLVAVIGSAASAIYYTVARLLETYVTPKLGWLLLMPKAPSYDGGAA